MCEWLDRSNPQLCIAVQISVIYLVEFKLLALAQQRLHRECLLPCHVPTSTSVNFNEAFLTENVDFHVFFCRRMHFCPTALPPLAKLHSPTGLPTRSIVEFTPEHQAISMSGRGQTRNLNNRRCECPLFSKMREWFDRSNPQLCIAVQISVIHLVEFKLLALAQQRLHK